MSIEKSPVQVLWTNHTHGLELMPDPQLQILRLYAELLSRHQTLAGTLTLAHGPACSATGLPAAVSVAGGTSLFIDPDTATVKATFRSAGLDFIVNTLDEALRVLKNEIRKQTSLSVALTAEPSAVLAEMRDRGVQPDLEVLVDNATTSSLALATIALTTVDGLVQPTSHALAWLSAHDWSEVYLPTLTTADLRALDFNLIETVAEPQRLQWLRRIPHYQRPSPKTGRALWLNPRERGTLIAQP